MEQSRGPLSKTFVSNMQGAELFGSKEGRDTSSDEEAGKFAK